MHVGLCACGGVILELLHFLFLTCIRSSFSSYARHALISFHTYLLTISPYIFLSKQEGEVPGEDAGDWAAAGEDEVRETNGKEGQ